MTQAATTKTQTPGADAELQRLLDIGMDLTSASPHAIAALPALQAALKRADVIAKVREALNDRVMSRFMPLMNTPLGFRTDRPNRKNSQPYDMDQVRTCMIEALLVGLRMTDNEWNIISDRMYVTREGLTRLLRDYPGLTDLTINVGVPIGHVEKGVVVPFEAEWLLDGKKQELKGQVPVRGGEYATIDQLLGKADRKIKYRVYAKVTGSELAIDGEVEPDAEAPAKPDKLAQIKAMQTNQNAQQADGAQGSAAGGGDTTPADRPVPAAAPGNGAQGGKAPDKASMFD